MYFVEAPMSSTTVLRQNSQTVSSVSRYLTQAYWNFPLLQVPLSFALDLGRIFCGVLLTFAGCYERAQDLHSKESHLENEFSLVNITNLCFRLRSWHPLSGSFSESAFSV